MSKREISKPLSVYPVRALVVGLLVAQAGLLGWQATRFSPTFQEPAFLAAGVSHWEFGRFDLYRVNPPLVRMVAAAPVVATGCRTDWTRFRDGPGTRPEFPVGDDFLRANGTESVRLIVLARWACLGFSLIGACSAYCWARDLYGPHGGLVTLFLYTFEPNLLAHGSLLTPDAACTALGILAGYRFWLWLRDPTWTRAILAGVVLGITELTKLSALILFGVWPLLWLIWRGTQWYRSSRNTGDAPSMPCSAPPVGQLAALLVLALNVINLGYGFERVGIPLGQYPFVSDFLAGTEKFGVVGNRFHGSWLGALPVPLPESFVLGFDSQKRDLESFRQESFLRGEWKHGGWWFYYFYGLLVKVPCGTMILWVAAWFVPRRWLEEAGRCHDWLDELVVLIPAATLFCVVSSQTEFNIHLRYVFPVLGLLLVSTGRVGGILKHGGLRSRCLVGLCLLWTGLSSLAAFPQQLSYFNELAGGSRNGHRHLQGSSLDWGQGLGEVAEWLAAHPEAGTPTFYGELAVLGPVVLGANDLALPDQSSKSSVLIVSASQYSRMVREPRAWTVVHRFSSGTVAVRPVE